MNKLPQDIWDHLSTYTGIPEGISKEIKINNEQKERYIKLWCISIDVEYVNNDLLYLWPLYQQYQSIHRLLPNTLIKAINKGFKNTSLLRWYVNSNSSTTVYYHLLELLKCINANLSKVEFCNVTSEFWRRLKYERDIPFICEIICQCLIMKNISRVFDFIDLLNFNDDILYHILSTSTSLYLSKQVNFTDFDFVDDILLMIFDWFKFEGCINLYVQACYYEHYEVANYIYQKCKHQITIYDYMDNGEARSAFREFNISDLLERDNYDFFYRLKDYDENNEVNYLRLMKTIVKTLHSNRTNAMSIFKLFYNHKIYSKKLECSLSKMICDSNIDINVLVNNMKNFGQYYGQELLSEVIIPTLLVTMKQISNTKQADRLKKMGEVVPTEKHNVYKYFVKHISNALNNTWLYDYLTTEANREQ